MLRSAALLLLTLGCSRSEGGEARTNSVLSSASAAPSAAEAPAKSVIIIHEAPPASPRKRAEAPEPVGSGQAFTAGIVEYRPKPKEVAMLTDVRSARHDGFDRIVFEFA